MSKAIDVSYDIPGDVEAVYAAITSEDWAAHKAKAFNDDSQQVSRTVGDGGAVTLVVSRGLPEGIPGFLEKFLPKGGRATQAEAWSPAEGGVRRGTWQGEIPGAPAKVSIPLVGGKAESFIVDMIGKLTAKEADLLASLV